MASLPPTISFSSQAVARCAGGRSSTTHVCGKGYSLVAQATCMQCPTSRPTKQRKRLLPQGRRSYTTLLKRQPTQPRDDKHSRGPWRTPLIHSGKQHCRNQAPSRKPRTLRQDHCQTHTSLQHRCMQQDRCALHCLGCCPHHTAGTTGCRESPALGA